MELDRVLCVPQESLLSDSGDDKARIMAGFGNDAKRSVSRRHPQIQGLPDSPPCGNWRILSRS